MIQYQTCPYDGGQLELLKNGNHQCGYCQKTFAEEDLTVYSDPSSIQMLSETDQIRILRQEGDFYKVKARVEEVLSNPKYRPFRMNLLAVYWQALLNEQYIVYVYTKQESKLTYFPTFYQINYESITDSDYYKRLIQLCHELKNDAIQIYQEQIDLIHSYKQLFFELKDKHAHFQAFLSFKHIDNQVVTRDYQLARKIYQKLSEMNKQPFFSEETLKKIPSHAWEPHIYYALYSAPTMFLICTDVNYINDGWVKNEWTRFLQLSKIHKKNIIIILPTGFPKSNLPEPLLYDISTGLERQFLFFDQEEDLLNQVVKKLDYLESSKLKDFKELYSNDYAIKEIMNKTSLTKVDKQKASSFIHHQIQLLDAYETKYYEIPLVTPKEFLEKNLILIENKKDQPTKQVNGVDEQRSTIETVEEQIIPISRLSKKQLFDFYFENSNYSKLLSFYSNHFQVYNGIDFREDQDYQIFISKVKTRDKHYFKQIFPSEVIYSQKKLKRIAKKRQLIFELKDSTDEQEIRNYFEIILNQNNEITHRLLSYYLSYLNERLNREFSKRGYDLKDVDIKTWVHPTLKKVMISEFTGKTSTILLRSLTVRFNDDNDFVEFNPISKHKDEQGFKTENYLDLFQLFKNFMQNCLKRTVNDEEDVVTILTSIVKEHHLPLKILKTID